MVVSPTYFGACADVAGLAEVAHARGVPLVVDEAWGAHLRFHPDLPEHALGAGADLVVSSTHKIVGSLTQSAMLHLGERRADRRGGRRPLRHPDRVDEPQRAAVRLAGRRPPPGRACTASELLDETLAALAATREAIRAIPGLDVLDERLVGRAGDRRLRPAAAGDRRARHRRRPATSWRSSPARSTTGSTSSSPARTSSSRSSGWASRRRPQASAWSPRCATAVDAARRAERRAPQEPLAPPPPWGELAMTPREAFLGAQEVVALRAGRRADRRRVARHLPAGDPERAPRRAPDPRDARLHRRERRATAATCAAAATGGWGRCACRSLGSATDGHLRPPRRPAARDRGLRAARAWSSTSGGFERLTTVIHLRGGGEEGLGEDVTYDAVDHVALQDAGADARPDRLRDARRVLRVHGRRRHLPGRAPARRLAPLPALGLRVGGARPGAAPGGDRPRRGARPRAAAGQLRLLDAALAGRASSPRRSRRCGASSTPTRPCASSSTRPTTGPTS